MLATSVSPDERSSCQVASFNNEAVKMTDSLDIDTCEPWKAMGMENSQQTS
jgi:hypothetical protein